MEIWTKSLFFAPSLARIYGAASVRLLVLPAPERVNDFETAAERI